MPLLDVCWTITKFGSNRRVRQTSKSTVWKKFVVTSCLHVALSQRFASDLNNSLSLPFLDFSRRGRSSQRTLQEVAFGLKHGRWLHEPPNYRPSIRILGSSFRSSGSLALCSRSVAQTCWRSSEIDARLQQACNQAGRQLGWWFQHGRLIYLVLLIMSCF